MAATNGGKYVTIEPVVTPAVCTTWKLRANARPVPSTPSARIAIHTRGLMPPRAAGRPAISGAAMTRCSVDISSWPAESWNAEISKCCRSHRV
ncbi:hypothetical protein GCM10018962_16390 [Dactylosporangium matsuzakiense]|uniref:Uncharacterized protein n=1 Tax=Dactylosporangium matsuzakiense TaxID=53360 RepID=A0A9W6KK14_9ACTN|nr:hypothetical protein GCM10017581_036660 [Dactylosporangium matsuzakiense]